MRIALITHDPRLYTSRRLIEAATVRGHQIEPLEVLHLSVKTGSPPHLLLRNGRPCGPFDAAIPRIGAHFTTLAEMASRALEIQGVPLLNAVDAIVRARDKMETLIRLQEVGLPVPRSELVRDLDQIGDAIERVGGAPVVIKPLCGSQGSGVILAESAVSAVSIVESLLFQSREFLIQEFMPATGDIRILVLRGRVQGVMARETAEDEFRSNIHRGAKARRHEMTAEQERMAIMAAEALGLESAGVDLLPGTDGPVLLEVNASPGLEGIETLLGEDLAGGWIEALEARVREAVS